MASEESGILSVVFDSGTVGVLLRGAVETIPFGRFAGVVLKELFKMKANHEANWKSAARLYNIIKDSEKTRMQLTENQIHDRLKHGPLKEALTKYACILCEIELACDEWKEMRMKFLVANRMNLKFSDLEAKLKDVQTNVLMAAVAQIPANQQVQHKEQMAVVAQIPAKLDAHHKEVMDQLSNLKVEDSHVPKSNIPAALPLYGRKGLLEELKAQLKGCGSMVSLSGEAGIGKSHCARTFANQWVKKDQATRFAFWVLAEHEDYIRRDYRSIIKALGAELVDNKFYSTSELGAIIWDKLANVPSSYEWVIIFDNAPVSLDYGKDVDGPELFKDWFFPTPLNWWSNGRILFTTQSRKYDGNTCLGTMTSVRVDVLLEDDAVEMLMEKVSVGDTASKSAVEAARTLVGPDYLMARALIGPDYLNGLPSNIELVASYIRDEGLTLTEYLNSQKTRAMVDNGAAASIQPGINNSFAREGLNSTQAAFPPVLTGPLAQRTTECLKTHKEIRGEIRSSEAVAQCAQVYDDSSYQECIRLLRKAQGEYISSSQGSHINAREEWAKQWADELHQEKEWALALNDCRKTALELLYKVCNLCVGTEKEKKEMLEKFKGRNAENICDHYEASQAELLKFKERRIEEIWVHCVVMDRANALYNMEVRSTGQHGLGWYSKLDETKYQGKYLELNPKGATMNWKLVWLFYHPYLSLGVDQSSHWMEIAAPPRVQAVGVTANDLIQSSVAATDDTSPPPPMHGDIDEVPAEKPPDQVDEWLDQPSLQSVLTPQGRAAEDAHEGDIQPVLPTRKKSSSVQYIDV